MAEKSAPRSDLACENRPSTAKDDAGSVCSEERIGGISVTRLQIKTEQAALRHHSPIGTYVTFSGEMIDRMTHTDADLLTRLLSGELRGMSERLTGKRVDASFSVFVAGLGNASLTADALGPEVVKKLTATRHLREYEAGLYRDAECASVSALAPGVTGETGIETLELLRGAVRYVKPDLVLVIDALAARSCARLASTVQLSDSGIAPGSGVGNHRAAVNRESLGVPVIAIGVPTVVHSATLVRDALAAAGIVELDEALEGVLETGSSFFVSPRESDVISARVSGLIAHAVELAFVGKFAKATAEPEPSALSCIISTSDA